MLNFLKLFLYTILLSGCAGQLNNKTSQPFSIIVIPDTQNAIDYRRQKNMGFAIDSSEVFIKQMQNIASKDHKNLAFVTSVGDVWQHQTTRIDNEHLKRGFTPAKDDKLNDLIEITENTKSFEIPKAIEGYRYLANAGIPFAVAPGNHDYDAAWFATNNTAHIGGLNNFLSAFSSQSPFFKGKPWYLSSFNNGTSSAQKFTAGGYTFLHFALEMQPSNEVLAWVKNVLKANSNLPTIISTHDYLNVKGQRSSHPVLDLAKIDPEYHNSPEQVWQKLVNQFDQIFMVLCGHQLGQAIKIDTNQFGNQVYQILSDFQERGQAGIDAGQALNKRGKPWGIGDGWYRIMKFDLNGKKPKISIKTYSSFYKKYSSDIAEYSNWYKSTENPELTDEEFYKADEFTINLNDFKFRFGEPDQNKL